uniref:ribosomal protein S3 n=1 Tax=Purpureocillium takamizusanense TaxID=2060973 RepID=UPI001FA6FB8E|nr:ribosomal protein S3 [Purpureocillium takamizusanense]UNI92569.1 ribosomal protein S3 [Purpureocillium takamizusanense]
MKVFKNNLKNYSKTIALKKKTTDIGKTKYLPSFSKEWKNIVYSYNKNNLKNIPVNNVRINKIIQSYFNLYFKDREYVGYKKFILLRKRRNFLKRIYISNAEIKHTNNKAIITLYIVNKEKKRLRKKYFKIIQKGNTKLIENLIKYYKPIKKSILNLKIEETRKLYKKTKEKSLLYYPKISKLMFKGIKLRLLNLFDKRLSSLIMKKYWERRLGWLRKYDLMYSLNQYKFNKQILLPKLSNILNKIIGKKIEYNIINLKSIAYNTDLFTKALSLKLKKRKKPQYIKNMFRILNRAYLPKTNTIKERTRINKNVDLFLNEYKDLKLTSNLGKLKLDQFLGNSFNAKEVHNIIYNSIRYKNMGGIRLEVKGRLTKRYRADRSIYSLKWKGGLKNIDSSFKGLSSVLFRGNSKSNLSYSLANSKRRIGAFAVKGWISGK